MALTARPALPRRGRGLEEDERIEVGRCGLEGRDEDHTAVGQPADGVGVGQALLLERPRVTRRHAVTHDVGRRPPVDHALVGEKVAHRPAGTARHGRIESGSVRVAGQPVDRRGQRHEMRFTIHGCILPGRCDRRHGIPLLVALPTHK